MVCNILYFNGWQFSNGINKKSKRMIRIIWGAGYQFYDGKKVKLGVEMVLIYYNSKWP